MDEPFGALDATTREYMNVWLQGLWLESRKTVMFITHSIPEAVFLGDRVIVMSSRPRTMDELVELDLPRPRTLQIMTSERFGAYVSRIRSRFGTEAVLG
jgi:NitT/TauT family transport system ATP-binding protein